MMKNEYLDTFSGFGKTAIDATKELVEINGRLMSKLLENQIKLANMFVESSEKQVSRAGTAKDPKDFMTAQAAFYEEYSSKLQAAAQAHAKLAQEASEELKHWFEKGVKTADIAVKDVAKKTATSMKAPVAAKAPAKKAAPKKPAPKSAAPVAAAPVAKKPVAKTAAKPVAKAAPKKAPAKKPAPKTTPAA